MNKTLTGTVQNIEGEKVYSAEIVETARKIERVFAAKQKELDNLTEDDCERDDLFARPTAQQAADFNSTCEKFWADAKAEGIEKIEGADGSTIYKTPFAQMTVSAATRTGVIENDRHDGAGYDVRTVSIEVF